MTMPLTATRVSMCSGSSALRRDSVGRWKGRTWRRPPERSIETYKHKTIQTLKNAKINNSKMYPQQQLKKRNQQLADTCEYHITSANDTHCEKIACN